MARQVSSKPDKRTIGAIALLVGPTALLILTFVSFAILNWLSISSAPAPVDGQLFGSQPVWVLVVNVLLWMLGVLGFIAWVPGLVLGIILLATRK